MHAIKNKWTNNDNKKMLTIFCFKIHKGIVYTNNIVNTIKFNKS